LYFQSVRLNVHSNASVLSTYRAMSAKYIATIYGELPPSPVAVQVQRLHEHVASHNHPLLPLGTSTQSLRVRSLLDSASVEEIHFGLQLIVPAAKMVRCMIVCGDGCWRTVSDSALRNLLAHDCAIAMFNRTEIAPDLPQITNQNRNAALYRAYPGLDFGAISAWAWGYARCVDAIATISELANVPIAFSGHSRGGKAALLAGATDSRAAFVHANNAGALGSASTHEVGEGSETWQALVQAYPHWVSAKLRALAANNGAPPFDQDALLGAISPRNVLITQAADDAWANPRGTAFLIEKLRPRFFGKLELIAREGEHPMLDADWRALLDFILK
jgi:hypothetical protein